MTEQKNIVHRGKSAEEITGIPKITSTPEITDALEITDTPEIAHTPEITDIPKITGILLAGGLSRRMGQNKALMPVGKRISIEQVLHALSPVCRNLLISANDPGRYAFLGMSVIPDVYPGKGPLAGIHACLRASATSWSLVAACDMPLVTADMAQDLVRLILEESVGTVQADVPDHEVIEQGEEERIGRVQAVIPVVEGRPQPLFALYHRSVMTSLEARLQLDELRLMDWLQELAVTYVPVEHLQAGAWGQGLFNMNRPQDYEEVIVKYRDNQP
ncbi:molybdenum cofactor guanylyltransferase [Paenibacillus lemnae]|uniref:Probable molybdenum cofactor guanylyltransferase n=1 Tax=Paenibacillus lemnae TaxID=1330551 RepID=A0A848M4D4_PAELE|nr:molybdenum cofactor guanylyltransferase [Paenibacillus lemnae]NMO94524.1 molybdenum cofactor guanylyltransferase [Paenibacillus lemnae]